MEERKSRTGKEGCVGDGLESLGEDLKGDI